MRSRHGTCGTRPSPRTARYPTGAPPMVNAFSPHSLDASIKELAKSLLDRSVVKPLTFIKAGLDRNATPTDPYEVIWSRAAVRAADYIEPRLGSALLFRRRELLWDYALSDR